MKMKRIAMMIISGLLVIGLLAGSAIAGIGDENWYGETGDQPQDGKGTAADDGNCNQNSLPDFAQTRMRFWL
jgi:hypothetical protein